MRKFLAATTIAAGLTAAGAFAPSMSFAAAAKTDLVEFGMMTWPEVKAAIASGKTTALVYTGGTEQRGPQNVNGGHTLMGEATVKAIAEKLGNAIAMPVLPFTPNRASAALPGTIGLTPELLGEILERVTEESITTGFKTVILMGDHGGGQGPLGPKNVYDTVAKKMDAKYAPQGIHVYYCDQVYEPANAAFDEYLKSQHMPLSSHAGIPDTSEMLYLGGDKGWVRKDLIPTAEGDPEGTKPADRKKNNGISGDARPSTAALGKKIFDMKVDYAVRQIQGFQKASKAG